MDNKTFCTRLAKRLAIDAKEVAQCIQSLASVVSDNCREGREVAIPGFGVLYPQLHKEEVRTDHSSGKNMLFPPEITIEFKPSASMQKIAAHEK